MLSSLYRLLTDLGAPFISLYLHRRLAAGREDARRFQERLGYASEMRPQGRIIWCHAASVGEAVSLLALIDRLQKMHPDLFILVTTGTVTSADMLRGRLSDRALHQYMPVDRMPYVTAFLDYWKPDCALWVESELWPNILAGMRARHIPAVLLNGRMSEKSFRNWRYAKPWIREILSTFHLCLTQTEDEKTRFEFLGARKVQYIGNLKFAASPLPYNEEQLVALKQAIGNRPLWLIASTHRGEEKLALEAHKKLAASHPGLLTVIVPRHAVRGPEIADLLREQALPFAQRSKKEPVTPSVAIYLADTMGELGLFYRLSPIAAIGGSFSHLGGHNPIEPAQLGAALILGPHMYNFSEITQEFKNKQAALILSATDELPAAIDRLLSSPDICASYAKAASRLAEQKTELIDKVLEALEPWLVSSSKNAA